MLKFLQRLIHSSRHKRKSPSALRQRLAFSKEDIKKHATEYAIERDGYVWVKSPGTWEDSRKLKLQCDGEGCYFRTGRGGSQKRYFVSILWATSVFPIFEI
jgi:hypothetical protein